MNAVGIDALTVNDVADLLRSIAPGDARKRELHTTPVDDDHGTVGSVYFSLDGSPPKAYAIYTPEIRKLSAYDGEGRRQRILKNVRVNGVVLP